MHGKHTQTVGENGPGIILDALLNEKLEDFIYSSFPLRVVHTKGFGAFGTFKSYQSMSNYTKLNFLQKPNYQTKVAVRFSFAVSNPGTPDTARNVRGFSTKFYTPDGVYDLLTNHIPVFLVQDAMDFPAAIRAFLPSTVNNLPDPNRFWGFVAERPESLHATLWLYSDYGTVKSFRHMGGYGVNTYVWINREGKRHYVKYHWIPCEGIQTIDRNESVRLAGENPNIAGQDLYSTLAGGKTVDYELSVQLMEPSKASELYYDPLDDTKIWDIEEFPLIPVGLMTLKENPEDYNRDVEKIAFSPTNLLDGIELSFDRMLQGRSLIYWNAQRNRLGNDFRKIPINNQENWNDSQIITSGSGQCVQGEIMRTVPIKKDYYTQPGNFYNLLTEQEKEHLVDNIASELYLVSHNIMRQVVHHLYMASPKLAKEVTNKMKMYFRKQ